MPFDPLAQFVGGNVRILVEGPCEKHARKATLSYPGSSPCHSPVSQHFMPQKSSGL